VLDVNKRSGSDCDANMSAKEIEKLVLTMHDVDSENVSDIFNSSSSIGHCEH
jgi:hypothetical protein